MKGHAEHLRHFIDLIILTLFVGVQNIEILHIVYFNIFKENLAVYVWNLY